MTRVLFLLALCAACGKKPAVPPPPDAAVEEIITPAGRVKRQIERTMEKEHEKTLVPRVE